MTSTWKYTTDMIRQGFEKHHIDMWQSLCQQAKTDHGKSREFLFIILDMARHNECDVLDIVKTGEVCSKQKAIDEKFMHGLTNMLNDNSDDEVEIVNSRSGVLDLTAEEEFAESGSYEEDDGYGPFDDDRPTSAEAYEIDGFVVADDEASPTDKTPVKKELIEKQRGVLKNKPAWKKRMLSSISEE